MPSVLGNGRDGVGRLVERRSYMTPLRPRCGDCQRGGMVRAGDGSAPPRCDRAGSSGVDVGFAEFLGQPV
eukprot:7377297-Prymnesium_polylepis.1